VSSSKEPARDRALEKVEETSSAGTLIAKPRNEAIGPQASISIPGRRNTVDREKRGREENPTTPQEGRGRQREGTEEERAARERGREPGQREPGGSDLAPGETEEEEEEEQEEEQE
jgi:hypothetical protein